MILGDSWKPALAWRAARPAEPFVGVRVSGEEIWVVFEPEVAVGTVSPGALTEIRDLFERRGTEAWCDEHVFLCQARSIVHGQRLARRVVEVLRRHGLRANPAVLTN
jgi:hypothetical protein